MLDKRLLVSFGCSWTFGVGSGYELGMSKNTYDQIGWNASICNQKSFRGILSQKFKLDNINFSAASSSNQKQFRLAQIFFSSPQWQELKKNYSKIIVIWGITSIYRNEIFDCVKNQVDTLWLRGDTELSSRVVKYAFNEEWELSLIATQMRFWNQYFLENNIKFLWFDTFNHHNYHKILLDDSLLNQNPTNSLKSMYEQERLKPDNQNTWPTWDQYLQQDFGNLDEKTLEQLQNPYWEFAHKVANLQFDCANLFKKEQTPRDLMSQLCLKHNMNPSELGEYHWSMLNSDSGRDKFLTNKGLLNPYTYHPTQSAHVEMADMLAPEIEKLLEV